MENKAKIELGSITLSAEWKKTSGQYTDSKALFVGKVKIVEYFYSAMRTKEDPKKYQVSGHISSIKSDLGAYATEAECEARCVEVVKVFFRQLQETNTNLK